MEYNINLAEGQLLIIRYSEMVNFLCFNQNMCTLESDTRLTLQEAKELRDWLVEVLKDE